MDSSDAIAWRSARGLASKALRSTTDMGTPLFGKIGGLRSRWASDRRFVDLNLARCAVRQRLVPPQGVRDPQGGVQVALASERLGDGEEVGRVGHVMDAQHVGA